MGNSDQPEGTMRVVISTSRSSCAYACAYVRTLGARGLDQQNVYMRTAMTATETMKGIIRARRTQERHRYDKKHSVERTEGPSGR